MSESYVQVTTTTDSREEAEKLSRFVIDNRLAACAQVAGPITSTYWWQGKVEVAEEWIIFMKTTGSQVDELVTRLQAEHSYDTPEIVATPIIGGNPRYLEWIAAETAAKAPS
jgi:periplasmic divalent cation tolerance protein